MARPMIWWRVVLGIIVTALIPGLVLAIVLYIAKGDRTVLPLFVFGQLIITVPTVLLWGPPLMVLYRRMGWESWWSFGLGGMAAACGSLLLLDLSEGHIKWENLAIAFLFYGVLGAIGALALPLIVYTGLRD